jgi:hypothetical protein
VLQKHAPADTIVAFERNFAGRTLALAEITDKAAYRQGLPLSGRVLYVPFYDADRPARTIEALDAHLKRYPGRVAGMLFELVQGEGGYHTAPPEFFRAVMERCRAAQIAVWVDEVQTFARTGELFAYRTFGLEEFVDVVTCGKALQGSAALFAERYNPKPGLIAGTYAGSTVGLAVGARIIERLETEGYLGPEGRISVLGERVARRIETLRKRMPRAVGAHSGIGAMHAFVPFDGAGDTVTAIVEAAFEEGLFVWSAARVRPRSACSCPSTPPTRSSRAASRCSRRRCAVSAKRGGSRADPAPDRTARRRRAARARAQLDSMNLPAEPTFLAERIAASQRSFSGAYGDWREGIYVFVLEDSDARAASARARSSPNTDGPGKPYFWLEVTTEERRSSELGVRFQHKKLQLRSTEDGPTEIGGIVLDPPIAGTRRAAARRSRSCASRSCRCTRTASSAR